MATDYLAILRRWWGYESFRGVQLDIIRSIGEGRDTLGLMPTGGGKSITFQVPAMATEGVCLVITPLIALMKDQVDALRRRGIKATAIHTGLTQDEIAKRLDNCLFGDYKFLYVSPERLGSEFFRHKLRKMPVSFITVDEAHCISQWGYDFRPAYLDIAAVRSLLPGCPVLALTATATPTVIDDIQERLGFRRKNAIRMSFARPNLSYVVRHTDNKEATLLRILEAVPGTAIVYTRSRQHTYDTARWLNEQGISAQHYHAGLTPLDKDLRQRSWQDGETRVIVATNAFGMGIDKPDVRAVVHLDAPDSIEAYFQEAGRAGRDGLPAYAVLLASGTDRGVLRRRVADTFPPKAFIRQVYDHLAYFFQLPIHTGAGRTFEFDIAEFCRNFKHFPVPVESALQILGRAGYLAYRDKDDNTSRLRFLVTRGELYDIDTSGPEDEAVLSALMRTYGGLFADYVSIDEKRIARDAGLSLQAAYDTLKRLTYRRILHYVPRRDIPHVTYLRPRIDGADVALRPEVYEQLRDLYAARVDAVLRYIEDDARCRSQQLLAYFGETEAPACGRCDVCVGQHQPRQPHAATDDASADSRLLDAVGRLCADGRPHPLDSLDRCGLSEEAARRTLARLAAEGLIHLADDGTVRPAAG